MVLPRPVRLVYAVGQRNVRFRHSRHLPACGRIQNRTELCIRRPCVLMHAGWSYREPSARCMRWGSIMFITPRHDINRPVENSEQTSVSTDLEF
ncbi:hypothetical protein TNCT_366731 [Trichonephila clavata]|uniref:Uncharacterized protein n=1 Tax=Trichonephila clavata TaxID=2740835 RepID=A0A8X6KUV1_TRICU|nr:hypothetical protein TNCT_366731 [Trichonephila clavata]